jgi:FkbM family methyltransferase
MTRDGFKMTVSLEELIGQHLYLRGDFDRSVVDVLIRLALPGDTLLDIGANIGYVSASFLHRVPLSTVLAVEPIPQNIALLRTNLSQFASYSVFPVALSNEDREGWMNVWQDNLGASRIAQDYGPLSLPVQIRSAATFLSGFEKVDLIKIDVEMHEREVLFSARDQLERLRPRAIVFEHDSNEALPDGPIWRLFHDLGYSVSAIRKRLTGYDLVEPQPGICINYLARAA